MDIKVLLEDLVDFMITNPASDKIVGAGYLITTYGWDVTDTENFLTAVGEQVIAVGMIPAPGGWEAIRDKAIELGSTAAKAFVGLIEKPLTKFSAIQIIILREQLAQIQPALDTLGSKIAAADTAILNETDGLVIEVLEDGRGVSQGALDALSRQADVVQQQIDVLAL